MVKMLPTANTNTNTALDSEKGARKLGIVLLRTYTVGRITLYSFDQSNENAFTPSVFGNK